MLGVIAVKHMATDENKSPTRKESGGINRENALETTPKSEITPKTIVELIRLFVAPHRSSPAMTSSRLIGVAIIASNVF
jgi:hypothetical protein